jgi:hypothetical protein
MIDALLTVRSLANDLAPFQFAIDHFAQAAFHEFSPQTEGSVDHE